LGCLLITIMSGPKAMNGQTMNGKGTAEAMRQVMDEEMVYGSYWFQSKTPQDTIMEMCMQDEQHFSGRHKVSDLVAGVDVVVGAVQRTVLRENYPPDDTEDMEVKVVKIKATIR
jgi:hypothetical protein